MASSKPVERFFRADFARLEPYAPVKPLDVLAAEIGVRVDELVAVSAVYP